MVHYMRLASILLVLCLIGCSPQKRLNRLIKNNPELAVQDTLTFTDTVYTETVRKDTVFSVDHFFSSDTLLIEKETVRVKIHTVRDSVFVRAECLPDTIIREISIPYEKYDVQTANWIQRHWLLIAVIALVLGFVASLKLKA